MKNQGYKLSIVDGFVSGLLFCWLIMLVARVNVMLFLQDMPVKMQEEVKALSFVNSPGLYEVFLMTSPILALIFWRSFRFLNKLNTRTNLSFISQYLHLLVWFIVISLTDLIVLDWLIDVTLRVPAFGVEHLLSEETVREYQSYGFHFKEHFFRPEAHVANALIPLVLLLIYRLYKKCFKMPGTLAQVGE